MKRKVYYAHCIAIYSTPQERRDIETLQQLGFEVVNPNTPEIAAGYEAYKKINHASPMDYFYRFAEECDCMAFRALPDGSIPAGIATEASFFTNEHKPVFELPSNWHRRVLTLTETRGYLTEVGQR